MVKTETDMCFQQFFSEILLFQQEIMKKCEKLIFMNLAKSCHYELHFFMNWNFCNIEHQETKPMVKY